jgi:hypothetical protein
MSMPHSLIVPGNAWHEKSRNGEGTPVIHLGNKTVEVADYFVRVPTSELPGSQVARSAVIR